MKIRNNASSFFVSLLLLLLLLMLLFEFQINFNLLKYIWYWKCLSVITDPNSVIFMFPPADDKICNCSYIYTIKPIVILVLFICNHVSVIFQGTYICFAKSYWNFLVHSVKIILVECFFYAFANLSLESNKSRNVSFDLPDFWTRKHKCKERLS